MLVQVSASSFDCFPSFSDFKVAVQFQIGLSRTNHRRMYTTIHKFGIGCYIDVSVLLQRSMLTEAASFCVRSGANHLPEYFPSSHPVICCFFPRLCRQSVSFQSHLQQPPRHHHRPGPLRYWWFDEGGERSRGLRLRLRTGLWRGRPRRPTRGENKQTSQQERDMEADERYVSREYDIKWSRLDFCWLEHKSFQSPLHETH